MTDAQAISRTTEQMTDYTDAQMRHLGSLYQAVLTLIPAWICNYTHYKVCDVITYPFPNFNSLGMGN